MFTRRVNLIFSSEKGAPRKVADFLGQKPWTACENEMKRQCLPVFKNDRKVKRAIYGIYSIL